MAKTVKGEGKARREGTSEWRTWEREGTRKERVWRRGGGRGKRGIGRDKWRTHERGEGRRKRRREGKSEWQILRRGHLVNILTVLGLLKKKDVINDVCEKVGIKKVWEVTEILLFDYIGMRERYSLGARKAEGLDVSPVGNIKSWRDKSALVK